MNMPTIESVAKALLINNMDEALILTIGEHKEQPDRSFKPDLPGGRVDPGENEHQAVVREISEETGISVVATQLVMAYSRTQFIIEESKSVTKHLFIANLIDKPHVRLSWEHSAYEWVKLESLQDQVLRSFYDEAIEYCFSNGILKKSA